jgi:hypothetical protein
MRSGFGGRNTPLSGPPKSVEDRPAKGYNGRLASEQSEAIRPGTFNDNNTLP